MGVSNKASVGWSQGAASDPRSIMGCLESTTALRSIRWRFEPGASPWKQDSWTSTSALQAIETFHD